MLLTIAALFLSISLGIPSCTEVVFLFSKLVLPFSFPLFWALHPACLLPHLLSFMSCSSLGVSCRCVILRSARRCPFHLPACLSVVGVILLILPPDIFFPVCCHFAVFVHHDMPLFTSLPDSLSSLCCSCSCNLDLTSHVCIRTTDISQCAAHEH